MPHVIVYMGATLLWWNRYGRDQSNAYKSDASRGTRMIRTCKRGDGWTMKEKVCDMHLANIFSSVVIVKYHNSERFAGSQYDDSVRNHVETAIKRVMAKIQREECESGGEGVPLAKSSMSSMEPHWKRIRRMYLSAIPCGTHPHRAFAMVYLHRHRRSTRPGTCHANNAMCYFREEIVRPNASTVHYNVARGIFWPYDDPTNSNPWWVSAKVRS